MKRVAIVLSAGLLPFAAFAAPSGAGHAPDYSYVQGDYIPTGNLHGTGNDYNGFGLEGSAAVTPNVFLNGRYDRLDVDNIDTDFNRGRLGVGANGFYDYGGADGTGIGYYGTVSYERLELRDIAGSADATGTGYGIDAGLRWMVDPAVEINPSVGWADYGSISGDGVDLGDAEGFRYGVRTLGHLSDSVAVSAEYRRTNYDLGGPDLDFDNEVRVGARYTF